MSHYIRKVKRVDNDVHPNPIKMQSKKCKSKWDTNYFKNWNIDHFTAENREKGYSLWIANGFFFFKDYYQCSSAFLVGFNIFDRWKIWKCLKKEIRNRALEQGK